MSGNEVDMALQTLISAMAEVAPSLDSELVRQCYLIQKKYQFSDDRAASMGAMERLIDALVTQKPVDA
ncbi:hypothetical protein ACFW16_10135 [Inquilinus sp. NPDC058860]|uniref:hypothetical protein n=1 Tax=Inquilinus sp. NPDC058860 TaxID=3346652 RepID=UPI00368505C1